MNRTIWTPTLAWLGAASAALVLAMAAPSESNVMGSLPALTAKRLDQQRIVLMRGPSDRTLALVAFHPDQRGQIQSWIQGLRLHQHSSIPWVKMPVLNDPGDEPTRQAIEKALLERHSTESARARLVPVFTNRQAFIRAAGLSGTQQASVLVLDRDGKVLARAEGAYHADKAQALRETLLAQD
ncbi:MAG TPA: hypothetical protein VLI46_00600 [Ramlibacter sp.]|nr:hypothetical protein [Ramlibacter sp.]